MGATPKDTRDQKTWCVLELTRLGEKAAVTGELEKHLKELFGLRSGQIFIPYKVCFCDSRETIFNVMEGYCFVEYLLDARAYISSAIDSPYLKNALYSKIGYEHIIHTIPNSRLEELRKKLNEMTSSSLSPGDKVLVLTGTFEGIEGEILEVTQEYACLHIKMRSFEAIRVFPKFALTPVGGETE